MSRFKESTDWGSPGCDGEVYFISEDCLILHGGGSFYGGGEDIDQETRDAADKLADKYGMTITSSRGEWYGYSEYTPDPGDVSIFEWRALDKS